MERISESIVEASLRRLLDVVNDGLVVADTQGRHLFVNEAFCRMTGMSQERLLGVGTPHPYWPPEHLDSIVDAFAKTAAGKPSRFELTFRRSDEERFPVAVSPAVTELQGEAVIVATVQDLTQRRAGEAQVRELRQLVDTMLSAGDISWWKWRLSDASAEVSDSYFTMLGYPAGAWTPSYEAWAKRVHPDDIGAADAKMQELLSDRTRLYDSEHRMLDASGEWRWMLARGYVVERRRDGSPELVLGTMQDIHQRKRQEETIQQFGKMEIVGQMAGGVAHDFNNLLAIVQGNLNLVLEDESSSLSAVARESLSDMATALERSSSLTQAMLQYSRLEPAESRTVDVSAVIEGIWPLLRSSLPANVKLSRTGRAEPLWVAVPPNQLESVLMNLIVNARDALDGEAGSIRIGTKVERLGAARAESLGLRPNYYLLVEVEDDGPGMTADVLRRAAEPLFTTKPRGKGTGLGLSIAKKFASDAGGGLRIESEVGKGTCVRLHFPLVDPPVEPRSGEVGKPGTRQGTVLVVDDEPALVRLIVGLLTRHGYRVRGAANPREALALLQEEPVEVLLTDVMMPFTIDGVELARRAKAMLPSLRVGFITAYVESESDASLSELGAVLAKPFSNEALLALADQLLSDA